MSSQFLNPEFIISLILAISLHEWAHAYMANREGDPTAKSLGRLTVNPLVHLDLYGTIALLLLGFGWGKPVPVDPSRFQRGQFSDMLVASGGILVNMLLAIFSLLAVKILALPSFVDSFLQTFAMLNLVLFLFNLFPLYPLDGEKILRSFLPLEYGVYFDRLAGVGAMILLGILLADSFLGFGIFASIFGTFVVNIFTIFGL